VRTPSYFSIMWPAWAIVFCLIVLSGSIVESGEIDNIASEVSDIRQLADSLGPQYLRRGDLKGAQYVAERLIDGENFYRTKDYQRAAIIFMDILENYPRHAAYPDALFLYADSLFLARDYLGSRAWFRKVLDEGNSSGFRRFRQKAIERLIEIAIHLDDFKGVDRYFSQLGQMPDAEALYVKGKYLYFKGEYSEARRVLELVSGDRQLVMKALYLTGVVLTQQEHHKEAIGVFLKGQDYKAETNEEQEILDLLNLGAGRLYFEQGFVEHASGCYQRVAQNSPYFDAALYEVAAVLIRAGDTIRAEQTLEVLTVAVPDSKYIPRAKSLRGNLLLRTGRYDEAEKVFGELVEEFTPVMTQLEQVMSEQGDTRNFFTDLVESNLATLDVSSILPPLVVKWVAEEQEVQRALELATDLGAAREYVRETERLIRLLEAVIDGPSRINAIPVLREAKRRAQQLDNRLGKTRFRLSKVVDEQLGATSAEIRQLRQERQGLVDKLAALPTTDAAFENREKKSRQIYIRMRKELARNAIRLDQLVAMTVAIERFVSDSEYTKDVPAENINALQNELRSHRHAVGEMRVSMGKLRDDIERARYQIGIGDNRDHEDADLRKKIREIAQREKNLLTSQGGELGRRLVQIYSAINDTEVRLGRFQKEVDAEATRQVEDMRRTVRGERDRVAGYHADLRILGDESEEVVGGVAFENFSSVRNRFHEMILQADVGIIDVAWLRKEEHTARITELTKGRIDEIKVLEDEFQEVRSNEADQAQ
jgi:tetratricopeptide (TPR) repeat protein